MDDDPGLGPSFWKRLHGLGDWIALVDFSRAWGVRTSWHSHNFARHLRTNGCRLMQISRTTYARREDVARHAADYLAASIASRLMRSGAGRQEALAALDRPEFAGMELDDIFQALAADAVRTFEALEEASG